MEHADLVERVAGLYATLLAAEPWWLTPGRDDLQRMPEKQLRRLAGLLEEQINRLEGATVPGGHP